MLFNDKKYIGLKLKEYRKKSSLTQEETALRVNLDEKHYGKLERGIFFPSLDTFFKLVEVLKIPINEFMPELTPEISQNKEKQELLKEIYLAREDEISAYLNIIRTIKTLKNN